jgi:hypothetical protein
VPLDGVDLIKALCHLTPEDDLTGEGAWTIPKILNGIRGLVQLALGDKILWAAGILRFIAEETGQQIHCCGKILNACLEWIAQRTKLLVRRGRKWELRLGELRRPNSALLRWMIRRGPLDVARQTAVPGDSRQPGFAGRTREDGLAPAAAGRGRGTSDNVDVASTAATSTAPTTSSPTDDAAPSSTQASPSSAADPHRRLLHQRRPARPSARRRVDLFADGPAGYGRSPTPASAVPDVLLRSSRGWYHHG